MSKSGIYRIVNSVNGRVYVGSAVNLERRNQDHFKSLRGNYHGNSFLQRAWNKYGEEAFWFEIVEYVEDVTLLLQAEQRHLDAVFRDAKIKPYNICRVAGSLLGTRRTPEQCARMGALKRGTKRAPAVVARHAEMMRGRKKTQESIAKRTIARAGFRHSDEAKAKISAAKKGKAIHTDEWKAKMSALLTGKKMDPSHGERLREAHRSLTREQVAEIVARRKAGESYVDLAKAFKSTKDTIRNWCLREGLDKVNIYTTDEQRSEIFRRRQSGESLSSIAKSLGVSEATVVRKHRAMLEAMKANGQEVSTPPSPDRPAPDPLPSHPEQLGLF